MGRGFLHGTLGHAGSARSTVQPLAGLRRLDRVEGFCEAGFVQIKQSQLHALIGQHVGRGRPYPNPR